MTTNKYLEKIAAEAKKEPSKLRAAGRGLVESTIGDVAGNLAGQAGAHALGANNKTRLIAGLTGKAIGAVGGAVHGYKASIKNQKAKLNKTD